MAKPPKASEQPRPIDAAALNTIQEGVAEKIEGAGEAGAGERQAAGDDEDAETARLAAVQHEEAAASGAPDEAAFAAAGIAPAALLPSLWPTRHEVRGALAELFGIPVEDVLGWNAKTRTIVTVDGRKLTWPTA